MFWFLIPTGNTNAKVKCARVFAITFAGNKDDVLNKIQGFLINPVDQRLASLDKPEPETQMTVVKSVKVKRNFRNGLIIK